MDELRTTKREAINALRWLVEIEHMTADEVIETLTEVLREEEEYLREEATYLDYPQIVAECTSECPHLDFTDIDFVSSSRMAWLRNSIHTDGLCNVDTGEITIRKVDADQDDKAVAEANLKDVIKHEAVHRLLGNTVEPHGAEFQAELQKIGLPHYDAETIEREADAMNAHLFRDDKKDQ